MMAEKLYDGIMKMIINSCNNHFHRGVQDEMKTIIECTTQIFIANMNASVPKEGSCERYEKRN